MSQLVTTKAASEVLGVHIYTVQRWVREGKFSYVAMGTRPIYLLDLDKFLRDNYQVRHRNSLTYKRKST